MSTSAAAAPLFDPGTLVPAGRSRPIGLTREGDTFRLSFSYNPDLVSKVRVLPYAEFDGATRTWTCTVAAQSVNTLRAWFYEGLVDVPVDTLLADGEQPAPVRPALLHAGSTARPFRVTLAMRGDDTTFARLRAVPGNRWEKKTNGLSYPPGAAAALAELVDRGVLDDPHSLLNPAGVTVLFDPRSGAFRVRGDDRAATAFAKHFPARDVMATWRERGLDVAFADSLTEEIYAGELARRGDGLYPDGLLGQLFPHQARNTALAVARTGHGVFDAPGVGKTLTGIAVGHELCTNRGKVTRTVVVVPGAVRTQWKREIVRFTGIDPDQVVVVAGDRKKRHAAYADALTRPWVVVNYDVLSNDLEQLKAVFTGALVIADEAHRLKTWDSKRSKAMRALAQMAARRLALTGTPLENSPKEFYELVGSFIAPGALGSPGDFLGRYMFPSPWGGYQGARNLAELHRRTAVYYSRHTMADVAAHLPPLRVQHLIVDPDPAYAAALRRAHKEARAEIKQSALDRLAHRRGGVLLDPNAAEEVATGAEMTATGMLRLLCSSPRLIATSEAPAAVALREAGIVPDEDGPKLDELRTMAAERKALQDARLRARAAAGASGAPTAGEVAAERFVVFTQSRRMADLISARFTEDGVKHVMFTGATDADERDAAVAAFTDPGSDVIAFVATDAGSEGLNLGRCCHTLISFEPAWTASRMEQRSCRIRRIDGTAPFYLVIVMTLAGTMEQGVMGLLNAKADLSDAVLGESGGRARTTGRKTSRWARANLVAQALTAYDEAADRWAGSGEAPPEDPEDLPGDEPTDDEPADGEPVDHVPVPDGAADLAGGRPRAAGAAPGPASAGSTRARVTDESGSGGAQDLLALLAALPPPEEPADLSE